DQPLKDRVPLHGWGDGGQPRLEVVALPCLEHAPHDLHVLLRHHLLLQPHGFERLSPVFSEVRQLDGLTIAERPHVPRGGLNVNAARLTPTAPPDEREHLVACVDQLFRFPADVAPFPCLTLALSKGTQLVATTQNHRVYETPREVENKAGRDQIPHCLAPF